MSRQAGENAGDPAQHDEPIQPLQYHPPGAPPPPRRGPRRHQLALGASLALVLLALLFLLSARTVVIELEPDNASYRIDGGPHLRLPWSRVLLRPGEYRLQARASGYETREVALPVNYSRDQSMRVELSKLPGRLLLATTPVPATVMIDGVASGTSNAEPLLIPAGKHTLRVEAERYLPQELALDIEGMEREQNLALELAPGWGRYRIVSEPPGATILLGNETLGTTPAELELMAGTRLLALQLKGFRDQPLSVEALAGEQRTIEAMVLQRADATLRISSRPAGASVTLNGVFQGRTPLELSVDSASAHELIAFKAGYERATRKLQPASGQQLAVELQLRALSGEVQISVQPPDAQVFSANRLLGTGSQTLSLPATPQTLSVRRAGYASEELRVTPRPGFVQKIAASLRTLEQQKNASIKSRIRTGAGQEMVLLRPTKFRMGSSRRDVGRRANETLREVALQKPFYLGVAEVSNAEFRQFDSAHSSGNFKGKSLNGEDQPASNLSWSDAARYCNWLSKRDGLSPFYRSSGKTISGINPGSNGYRLPTEAEWAWAASVAADGSILRFPWGAAMPPPAKSGNFADQSGATLLGDTIAGYDDGFAVAAPRNRFAANRHGIFDLAGNTAEWVHDYYEAAAAAGGVISVDPTGPEIGEFHVIRGSSWRQGGVTELRLAFRDYGKAARPDVGFRLARYLE